MLSLLKKLHDKAEGVKGKNLFFLIVSVFVAFTLVGILIGYFSNKYLNDAELMDEFGNILDFEKSNQKESMFEGKIKYVDPNMYKADEVEHVLVDSSGKQIILLKAKDEKLAVAENLYAKLYGKVTRSGDNKSDILVVERISISNGTN